MAALPDYSQRRQSWVPLLYLRMLVVPGSPGFGAFAAVLFEEGTTVGDYEVRIQTIIPGCEMVSVVVC